MQCAVVKKSKFLTEQVAKRVLSNFVVNFKWYSHIKYFILKVWNEWVWAFINRR